MNFCNTKKTALTALFLIALAACGPVSMSATLTKPVTSPALPKETPVVTLTPTQTPAITGSHPNMVQNWTPMPEPESLCSSHPDRICLRWSTHLYHSSDYEAAIAESAIEAFNGSQDKVWMFMETIPYSSMNVTLTAEIAANNGPDMIGPLSWGTASRFHGEWLDLKNRIAAMPDLSIDANFNSSGDATSESQIGLPYSGYPSAIFYNATFFDKAGLAHPPSTYGPGLGPAIYKLDGKNVEWNWETMREVSRRLTLDVNGKNATQVGFDKDQIVQYGFTWGYQTQPSYLGTYWGNGSYVTKDGKTAQLPDAWKDAWAWTYDGIWGAQPFIPNGKIAENPNPNKGFPFESGKVAMMNQPSWYMSLMQHYPYTWDVGVLPAYKGKIAGRMDVNFFSIWKGSKHPDEAFQALVYITTYMQKYMATNSSLAGIYPVLSKDQSHWLNTQKREFPTVKHLDIFITNLSFLDSPNAEAYMPNYEKAWDRGKQFYDLFTSTGGLDLEQEEAAFLADLQAIFDEKPDSLP